MLTSNDTEQLFVTAWLSLGSILNIASKLEMNCDDVFEYAESLRARGVELPSLPLRNDEMARQCGLLD